MNDRHESNNQPVNPKATLHQAGYDHDHDHSHDHTKNSSQGRLALAAVITGLFMVVEVIGGLISGSLALLADAGHMMTDFAALSLAWAGFAMSRRAATWKYTFGYARFQTLTAFLNGLTLVGVAIWIVFEAYHRIQDPSDVLAGPMLYVATAGLVVNLFVFWVLTRPNKTDAGHSENLNMRGAVLHVLGDLLGSVAAIIAAAMIMATGWMPIDPILSVLVALLILKSAWMLICESAHVLLQGAPKHLDRRDIIKTLESSIAGLISVENFHIWTLNADRPIVSLQAFIDRNVSIEEVSVQIKSALYEAYGIDHATIDVMYPLNTPRLEAH